MSEADNTQAPAGEPKRRYKWRYGPLRLVLPWLSMIVGAYLAIRWSFELDSNPNALLLVIGGICLIILGIGAFFLYRWMAKRGI